MLYKKSFPALKSCSAGILKLPPLAQIACGILLLALGIALAVYLWGQGALSAASLVLLVLGFLSLYTGLEGRKRKRKIEKQTEMVQQRGEVLVEEIIRVKKAGGKPIRFLFEQGIEEPEIRRFLLDWAEEEMKSRQA